MKRWRLREAVPSSADEALSAFPELLRPLLHARGLADEAAARLFLGPDYERDLHDPFLMKDMVLATDRIKRALRMKEKIVVFGDYDADGIPGAALLASFFDRLGYAHYEVYIPDRHEEAYGLNVEAVAVFAKSGATLIITVDCGVSNHREIALAASLGLDVIVTDHHTVPETLPPACAVVDPKRSDDKYPYKMLAGAGVAFKLVQALVREFASPRSSDLLASHSARPLVHQLPALISAGWEKWLLDLVAIATVADMVPLTGENRALVHFGLIVLRKSPRPGIIALCRALALDQSRITADDIAFFIGPRLNAASRMAHGHQAYELLTAADSAKAAALAAVLEGNNRARRASVGAVLAAAETMLAPAAEAEKFPLVAGNPDWPLGVLGLAASRLAERYRRPVFLWAKNGRGEVKGSCRGGGSMNVVSLMRLAGGEDFFINFGGHVQAGGFSLVASRIGELPERLAAAYRKLGVKTIEEELVLDAELSLASVDAKTVSLLNQLGPFGLENPNPTFLFRNIPSVAARSFGADRLHLELTLADGEVSRRAVGFFMPRDRFNSILESDQPIDLAATLERSYFRGRDEFRLRIVDLRAAE